MFDRKPIRQSELLASGHTLKQLLLLSEYVSLDGESCYFPDEFEEKLGREEGGDA
jgi:hypothetical protein